MFTLKEATLWFQSLDLSKKYLVVNFKGQPIGYFRLEYDTASVKAGLDLAVNYRGFGLGYLAWLHFLKKCKEEKLVFVWLEVLGTNIRAYNLYRKLGFTPSDVENHIIQGGNVPSIQMIYHLR